MVKELSKLREKSQDFVFFLQEVKMEGRGPLNTIDGDLEVRKKYLMTPTEFPLPLPLLSRGRSAIKCFLPFLHPVRISAILRDNTFLIPVHPT